jgi:hypothetical protein
MESFTADACKKFFRASADKIRPQQQQQPQRNFEQT